MPKRWLRESFITGSKPQFVLPIHAHKRIEVDKFSAVREAVSELDEEECQHVVASMNPKTGDTVLVMYDKHGNIVNLNGAKQTLVSTKISKPIINDNPFLALQDSDSDDDDDE